MLNKHFQRQVKSLHVFCHHKNRGCGWQGELAAFHHHVESCSMRDGPLLSDVLLLNVSTFGTILIKLSVHMWSEGSASFGLYVCLFACYSTSHSYYPTIRALVRCSI